jgi:pimeloyl-ACP methyl ester carboxylesterase
LFRLLAQNWQQVQKLGRRFPCQLHWLAQIPQPVEVWQGGADNLVPPVWAEQMHRELRRSKLHMVDGLGHFLAHTQIDAILHAIKAAKS